MAIAGCYAVRGKSMLAQSVMIVVFVPDEKINLGSEN